LFSSLDEWRRYLEDLNPDRIELGLDRVRQVFSKLKFSPKGKVIVVAGTNGKGSTVAALEAMISAGGHSVGTYTSPHLQHFNERIRVNGVPVEDQALVEAFQEIERLRGEIPLTYFEFMTLAAIWDLVKNQPDYYVFEVGLGGRLDAVNILDADIAIVTGVALDHMDWLGDNCERIGFEKAGIYRSGVPAIFASLECPESVKMRVAEIQAIPYFAGQSISAVTKGDQTCYSIQKDQAIQQFSLKTSSLPNPSILAALTALVLLDYNLSKSCLEALQALTIPGRYQSVKVNKTNCLLDVAHNPQAVEFLAARLKKESAFKPHTVVVGLMSDKVLEDVFRPLLEMTENWLIVKPETDRAASIEAQRQCLLALGVKPEKITKVGSINALSLHLYDFDSVVVYGSFYTVGEFLSVFGGEK